VRQSGAVFRSTDILKHCPPREPQTRTGKKRGPKPVKCRGAVHAMREAIRSAKYTAESLHDLPQEALAAEFCGSPTARETARKARGIVLSELSSSGGRPPSQDGEAQPCGLALGD
jgi:hypothetical protein